ncbi:hypothetical protein IKX12_00990 [Candidatus Saccharibacteria bacterium]|nr:hypothetical protein [Candidatus Saccharibacteria bacterium]
MIKNPSAKINFSDKDKTIMLTNHNYYVRTAIATLADIFLTWIKMAFITIGIILLTLFILYLQRDKMGRYGEQYMMYFIYFCIALVILMTIIFLIYVIVKIGRISTMRKAVNRIESKIIDNCTVAEPKDEEKSVLDEE